MVLTGPFYYPVAYFYYCIFMLAYIVFRSFLQCVSWTYVLINLSNFIKQDSVQQKVPIRLNNLYHAIIIPSYKEDFDILSQTIANLASH
jgi:cellulose synthase/poly-beta-1,6-N-acetylglucosamine synthase-like glycosyltransferase